MNLKLRPTRSRPILKGIARSNRVRLRLCLFERAACALSAIGTSGHAFSRTSCPLSGLKRTSHGPVATSTREAAPRRLPQLRQEGAPQFPPRRERPSSSRRQIASSKPPVQLKVSARKRALRRCSLSAEIYTADGIGGCRYVERCRSISYDRI